MKRDWVWAGKFHVFKPHKHQFLGYKVLEGVDRNHHKSLAAIAIHIFGLKLGNNKLTTTADLFNLFTLVNYIFICENSYWKDDFLFYCWYIPSLGIINENGYCHSGANDVDWCLNLGGSCWVLWLLSCRQLSRHCKGVFPTATYMNFIKYFYSYYLHSFFCIKK